MKKQLLLGSALLAAISAFPQNGRTKPQPSSMTDMAARLAHKYDMARTAEENTPHGQIVKPIGPNYPVQRSSSNSTVNWISLAGSMNIYGMLVSNSKPLMYHDRLNAISFVHRKSFTYNPSPAPSPSGAVTGAIVAEISSGIAGTTWDSTCVWNNNTNWARYPQGGIYSAPGNTLLSSAYVVASGPVTTAANSWSGSYLASKKLDTFNNVASTVSGAQQFIPNTAPYASCGKTDFPRCDFAATDDGAIRVLGILANNVNGTGAAYGFRGASILKGTFNSGSGTFTWTGDSVTNLLTPLLRMNSSGSPMVIGQPHMAWNQAGTVGYIWFVGCRNTTNIDAESGYQPIVFKWSATSPTWTPLPAIPFNNSYYKASVLDHVASVNGSTVAIPFFNVGEDVDGVVDANDNLHIVSTIVSTYSDYSDSLGYTSNFLNADGERYAYLHGTSTSSSFSSRPYIYDFTSVPGNNIWTCTMIDSMSSEGPGETSGTPGYGANPWDAAGGTSGTDKVSSDARIQVSRSADGRFIFYSWAESDTAYTTGQQKWNNIPNIKVRAVEVTSNGATSVLNLSPTEINATSGGNVLVASNAQMHYMSPISKVTATTTTNYNVTIPMTVSNDQSVPMTQLLPNTHWYSSAAMTFARPTTVDIANNALTSVNNSVIYPNPASGSARLSISLKDNSKVDVKVMNLVGDVMKISTVEGQAGDNNIRIDLGGLSSGIYMVNIKVGNANTSKKLIVE